MLAQLAEHGWAVAEQISKRASLAVELAGPAGGTRETFHKALLSIAGHFREISKEGLPKP